MAAAADPERRTGDSSRSDLSHGSNGPENASDAPFSGLFSDELAAKSAAAAAGLFRKTRPLFAENEELAGSIERIAQGVKGNPLGAAAIGFATGFILALLRRG